MNKKALVALLIAICIPIASYLILKTAGSNAVVMPKKYLFDSVNQYIKDGKLESDTLWHITKNIRLVNQLGDSVNLYDKPGKIMVIDFFFTHCRSICPALTRNMAQLQKSFLIGGNTRKKIDTSIVQFVSMSIDADRDSVTVLKKYADKFGVNHDNWWFLTGDKKAIAQFAFEELKVDKFSDAPVDSDFVHTNRFVLLDKNYVVRGYYNGLDKQANMQLAKDIGLLMLEKDAKKKGKIFRDIIDLSWLWFVIVLAISFFIYYLQSKREKNT